MASLEEISATIEARMEEILAEARPGDPAPRSTITPDRSRADAAGRHALELLRTLGATLEVGRTLGEGGMGVVREGRQVALGRGVAVKTLKPELRSDAATLKLLREAWVTGLLEHPNVVPIYDISLDAEGAPRIVLKKIAGSAWCDLMRDPKVLRDRFSAHDPLEWNLRILMQVANAVHFAHSHGILHRDLKPENVMIGQFGEVYLLDWGIAVSLRDDGTGRLPLARDAHEMAGTPAYMAPEMLGGPEVRLSERTDVYLLGAVLFEILAGRPPHDAESFVEILHQIVRAEPPVPAGAPAELGRIVRRALDPDPDARFENAQQFRLALAGFLEHRGSLALADEASARLAELEAELRTQATDPDEQRQRLYHLFGECRFGFLQALRTWKENDEARHGLRRAVTTMIELELEQGDPKAAALLLGELEDAPPELGRRVAEARSAREADDRRRSAIERDQDPSIGRRTRVFLGIVLSATWTISPTVAYFVEGALGGSYVHSLLFSGLMIAFASGLWIWARDSMSRTAINRRASQLVGVALCGQIGVFAVAGAVGIPYGQSRPFLALHYALVSMFAAAVIERRLWPTAVAYVLVAVVTVFHADWGYFGASLAAAILAVNLVSIWGSLQGDVVTPLRERSLARRRAWQDFLERRRARESAPDVPGGT